MLTVTPRVAPRSGRSSSVGSVMGSLSCVMQHHGFDPPRNPRGKNSLYRKLKGTQREKIPSTGSSKEPKGKTFPLSEAQRNPRGKHSLYRKLKGTQGENIPSTGSSKEPKGKKFPLPDAQRRIQPATLHQAGQRTQHTTN